MLHAWSTIRNLREIVAAHLFLFLETEWTMIRRYNLEVVALQSIPQLFLMPFLAQGGSEYILCPFKSWRFEVFDRQVEILRASLSVHGKSTITRFSDFLEGIVATHVDDVNWSS